MQLPFFWGHALSLILTIFFPLKILYAIQGTGNGHLTVALEVLPYLMKKGEVDILISGAEVEVTLPYPVKYHLQGLCFVFGKKGGIDYLETFKKAKLKNLFREIKDLPVEDYDLVLSDFEPVSAWACYLKGKACIGFSHQAAVVNKQSPKPKTKDLIGQAVLKYYAPVSMKYGFHFLPYNKNIFTPVIRQEIRQAHPTVDDHYTVYLPSFNDKRLRKLLVRFPKQRWEVFSKRCTESYTHENISYYPVTNKAFVKSIISAQGIFCGAGFQTPSEAIFLRKKVLVIPMKGQYEQQCNAAALQLLGFPVIKNIKEKQYEKIKAWIDAGTQPQLSFPDETEWIVEEIIDQHYLQPQKIKVPKPSFSSASTFRNLVLKKIFYQTGS